MEKITFKNGQAPYINDTNLNKMQDNIEKEFEKVKENIGVLIHTQEKNVTKELGAYQGFSEQFVADDIEGYDFVSYISCTTNGCVCWIGAIDGYTSGNRNLNVFTCNATNNTQTSTVSIKAYSLYVKKQN